MSHHPIEADQSQATNPWVIRVPSPFLDDRMSDQARTLLLRLESMARTNPFCYPGNDLLAKGAGKSPRSIQTAFDSLEELGWIKRVYKDESKRRRAGVIMLRRIDPGMPCFSLDNETDESLLLVLLRARKASRKGIRAVRVRLRELRTMPYDEYLKTPEWRANRESKINRARGRCQVCNASDHPLNVHHRSYRRLGHERFTDLVVLCRPCHQVFHENRKLAKE